MAIRTVRPLVRGESNLSGVVCVILYGIEQLNQNMSWPYRSNGLFDVPLPLVGGGFSTGFSNGFRNLFSVDVSEREGAVVIFDVDTGKGDFVGSGPITNKTYIHTLEGKVSGIFQEQLDSLEDLYNQGCIAIAVYRNMKKVVYGSTRAPLFLVETGTTAMKPEDDGKGIVMKFESIVGSDFPPMQLSEDVVTPFFVPEYPVLVDDVTP